MITKTKIFFLIAISLVAFLEVLADFYFKKWGFTGKNYLLWIGLLIYFSSTVVWALSLKYEDLSKAITVFSVLNLVGAVLVGVLIFNETLSTPNKLGIILGLMAVILVEFF